MTDTPERCGTCAYFDPETETGGYSGRCRLKPPTVAVVIKDFKRCPIAVWPTVSRDRDWCGYHVSK